MINQGDRNETYPSKYAEKLADELKGAGDGGAVVYIVKGLSRRFRTCI